MLENFDSSLIYFTIPQNVFSAGDMISLFNVSTNNLQVLQGTGVTLYNSADGTTGTRTMAAKGMCTVVCTASNEFVISGTPTKEVLGYDATITYDHWRIRKRQCHMLMICLALMCTMACNNQTVNNGIDLAGEGGLIWTKWRKDGSYTVESHALLDTERGFTKLIKSDDPGQQSNVTSYFTPNSHGYEITTASSLINQCW